MSTINTIDLTIPEAVHRPRFSWHREQAYRRIAQLGVASLSDVSRALATSRYGQNGQSNVAADRAIRALLTRGLICEGPPREHNARSLSISR